MSGNTNPGNFANRPQEEVSSIAQKGGEASHNGGFASMDPDKQVSLSFRPAILRRDWDTNVDLAEGDRLHGRQGI